MGFRVVVNMNLCESNALCMGAAPDVFQLGDDDLLCIVDERPGDDARTLVEAAIRLCPKQALSVVND